MNAFETIRVRLDRADSQVEHLHVLTAAWIENQNLHLGYHHDEDAGIYTIQILGFKQPPVEWGVIVGEVIHNLRAALDNTIYQLVILNGTQPPKDNHLQFPIASQPGGWKLHGGGNLRGASQKVIAAVEQCQPFNATERPHPLELLAALNDIDKHRLVHPAVTRVPEWRPPIKGISSPAHVAWQRNISDGSVEETAVRYRVHPPHARLELDMDAPIPIYVAFGQLGSLIHHAGLRMLSQEIRGIISGLANVVGEAF